MNYALQFNTGAPSVSNPGGGPIRTNRPLDYSGSTLGTLDENALNEGVGIGGPPGRLTMFGSANGIRRIAPAQGAIDWNGLAGIDPTPVAADINYFRSTSTNNPCAASPGQQLPGHDDWHHLIYDFRSAPDYDDGANFSSLPDSYDPSAENDPDVLPPSTQITSPANNQSFSSPANITITADATPVAPNATIVKVEFYQGATKLGEDATAPYSFTWSNVSDDSYSLSTRAVDSFGLVGVSTTVSITVGACATPTIATQPANAAISEGQSATLTAAFNGTAVLTYQWYRGPVGVVSDPVNGGTTASIIVAPAATTAYWVRASNSCGSADSVQATVTVTSTAPLAPTGVSATSQKAADSSIFVHVSWNPVSGADHYAIKWVGIGGTTTGTSNTTSYDATAVSPGNSYWFSVQTVTGTAVSADSARDLATTVVFTDDIVPRQTHVAAVHVTELRTAVDAVRTLAGLSPGAYTDPNLAHGSTIKAVHIADLRTNLSAALSILNLNVPSFTDPTLTPGQTRIQAAHITELRDAVK